MSSSQELEELYYKFDCLKEELSSKNEEIQRNIDDFKGAIGLLLPHSEEFKDLSLKIQESINVSIPIAAKQIAKEATYQLEENIKLSLTESINQLIEASRETERLLDKARNALSLRNWLIGIIAFASTLVTALSISYFYLQRIETLTTKQFIKTYKYGLLLKEIWPKLNEGEKLRLSQFLREKF